MAQCLYMWNHDEEECFSSHLYIYNHTELFKPIVYVLSAQIYILRFVHEAKNGANITLCKYTHFVNIYAVIFTREKLSIRMCNVYIEKEKFERRNVYKKNLNGN